MLIKRRFRGKNTRRPANIRACAFITLPHFARPDPQQAWWSSSEAELQIKAHLKILGDWGSIEMEDGTGLKLLISHILKSLLLGTNILLFLLARWWRLLVAEPILLEKMFSSKFMKQKALNGKNSTHCKDLDTQFGQLIRWFICMVDSKMKLQIFRRIPSWK